MIVLQGVNNETTVNICNNDGQGCWECDTCSGPVCH